MWKTAGTQESRWTLSVFRLQFLTGRNFLFEEEIFFMFRACIHKAFLLTTRGAL